jgi:hypothetical protein
MNQTLANKILEDDLLRRVHQRALEILSKGLTAGDRYPEAKIQLP